MSWGTCYSGSNNINFNFPPIMSDGRNYARWQPDAVINEELQKNAGITSNWEYRKYLQKNGLSIINDNSLESYNELGYYPFSKSDKTPSSNVPYKFKGIFDTSTPGFGYCSSDLKNLYLSREQLNARMCSPQINLPNEIRNKK